MTRKKPLRGTHTFKTYKNSSLIIYASMPDQLAVTIRIEPHRVGAVLAACGDALAKKPSTR